jgi:hypothetical protein
VILTENGSELYKGLLIWFAGSDCVNVLLYAHETEVAVRSHRILNSHHGRVEEVLGSCVAHNLGHL